jgi:hypothetical protein
MADHPGAEYLAAAFGVQEERRLRYIEEARRREGSVWFQFRLWDGTDSSSDARRGTSKTAVSPVEPRAKPDVLRRSRLSRTTCGCCGREFAGRRSDAKFCGPVCQKRSARGRCESEVA